MPAKFMQKVVSTKSWYDYVNIYIYIYIYIYTDDTFATHSDCREANDSLNIIFNNNNNNNGMKGNI
jgi:hypothetical protein